MQEKPPMNGEPESFNACWWVSRQLEKFSFKEKQ
jgi:hypothetical protein